METNVSAVYIQVVDDVIRKIRDEFINEGVGENALTEIQTVILSPPSARRPRFCPRAPIFIYLASFLGLFPFQEVGGVYFDLL